jgi:hypothetical protein
LRKWSEYHLKLEFFIAKNPARVNDAIKEDEVTEASLRPSNLGLIYFKIRNKSDLVLQDNSIWIEFPRGFIVLDEDEVDGLPAGTSLGTLQKDCIPLLHPEKPPTFKNLIWGKGKQPTLLLPHLAFYDPCYKNQTTILRGSAHSPSDLFIPVWVKTPEKAETYEVKITVKLRDINRDLPLGILTLHVQ